MNTIETTDRYIVTRSEDLHPNLSTITDTSYPEGHGKRTVHCNTHDYIMKSVKELNHIDRQCRRKEEIEAIEYAATVPAEAPKRPSTMNPREKKLYDAVNHIEVLLFTVPTDSAMKNALIVARDAQLALANYYKEEADQMTEYARLAFDMSANYNRQISL